MKLPRAIAGEFVGLFLDDEFLVAAALMIVSAAGILVKLLGIAPLVAGGLLLGGCIAVLLVSIWRAAHRMKPAADGRSESTRAA